VLFLTAIKSVSHHHRICIEIMAIFSIEIAHNEAEWSVFQSSVIRTKKQFAALASSVRQEIAVAIVLGAVAFLAS
jgi:hypothetical protein